MRSINRFTIHGNVGSVKPFDNTVKVSIATNRNWTNDKGERESRTDWVTITAFDELASWIKDNVTAGQPCLAEGRITDRSYDKGGETVYTTDLIASTFNGFAKP